MIQREIDTYRDYYMENNTKTFNFFNNFTSVPLKQQLTKIRKIMANLNEYYPDWMSLLHNSRRLDTITIPGSHDTGALHGGPLFKCQDRTIEEQLLMGIRFLDIRCRHINNVFMIHHAIAFQNIGFGGGVRDVCVRFLQQHPTEVIFILLQEEWIATGNSRTFEETMYSYINCSEFRDYFYLNEGQMPPIKEVRGKIILLRRFNKDKLNNLDMGNYIKFIGNAVFVSNTTIVAYAQDCYKIPTVFDRSTKFKRFENFFHKPKEFIKIMNQNTKTTLFLNYGSGTSAGCYPYLTAEYMMPRIGKYVGKSYPNDFLGIIVLDFVNRYSPKIIYNIIQRNFIPEQNWDLPNTFTLCDQSNCTNKADGTNQLIVALVVLAVILFVILIVIIIVIIVRRIHREPNIPLMALESV